MIRILVLFCATAASVSCFAVDYLKDVKPLLEHKCYACHGGLKALGGLRLDTAAALIQGGDSGETVSGEDPADSYLVDVLTGDAGFQMPPEGEGTPFKAEEIELVREWIRQGAPVPEHEEPQADPATWWSYMPIERPQLPSIAEEAWCRNEVDYFIAAKRVAHKLPTAAEASKEQWQRRVFLDLIGLPPTREEQQRFLADESPTAYENLVDDLLSRPQYGERWGRHWMDVWRYSDWYGSRSINEIRYSQRHIWRWRDWIVKSLNSDKGYDQMVREMLAGDEIGGGNPETLAATGYLGRSWYKFDRNVWLFETVERTGEAFLGLTLRCCRCHDHKFDPVEQTEYYQFRAFFEPHDVRTDPVSALTGMVKDGAKDQVLADGVPLVYDKTPDAETWLFERGDDRSPDKSASLAPGVPAALKGSVSIEPVELPVETWFPMLRPGVRETLLQKEENAIAAAEQELAKAKTDLTNATALRTAALRPDAAQNPDLQGGAILLEDDFAAANSKQWKVVNGKWNYDNGLLTQSQVIPFATMVSTAEVTGDFDVRLRYRPLEPGRLRSVGFSFDYVDHGNSSDVYTSSADDKQLLQAFYRTGGRQFYPRDASKPVQLELGPEILLEVSVEGSTVSVQLNGEHHFDHVLPEGRRNGKLALWVHNGSAEFLELKVTQRKPSAETLAYNEQRASDAVVYAKAKLAQARGSLAAVEKRLEADLAKHVEQNSESAAPLAVEARAAELNLKVLEAKAEVAKNAALPKKLKAAQEQLASAQQAAANPTGDYTSVGEQFPRTSTGRRTALADWIVRPDNPRTARVAANHLWGRHFGRPLVDSPENFGLNGRSPSHPQLLDWLATELIQNDWKMKALHRKLVLSATYRMSSSGPVKPESDELRDMFADARLHDSENRFYWRMNVRRMEAELVRDSILHLSSRLDLAMGGPEIAEDKGESVLRRSLYFRSTPNEKMLMLEVFDVADPNACYKRKESVVPHQSLAMMNSGLAQDSARILAKRLADEPDFITAAFETILSRLPTADEYQRCRNYLGSQTEVLQAPSKDVFAVGGSSRLAPASDPATRARENMVHVLFLHNDFVTVR